MPVTRMSKTLALTGLFLIIGVGAAVAGGAEGWGDRGQAPWDRLALEFRACALGERQTPIDVRYVNPATKLSPCSFNYNFVPPNNAGNWQTVRVAYGFGRDGGGALALDGKTLALVKAGFTIGPPK